MYTLTTAVPMVNPNLAEPRAFKDENGKEKGEPKHGAQFLFDPQSIELVEMKKLMTEVARAKWGTAYQFDPKSSQLRAVKTSAEGKKVWDLGIEPVRLPLHLGEILADKRKAKRQKNNRPEDEQGKILRGKVVLKTTSIYRPKLGFLANGGLTELESDDSVKVNASKFYNGAEALAVFNFKAVGMDGKQYVTAYLQSVVVNGKGKRIAGGQSLADQFKGYVGKPSMEDPIGHDEPVDDEIPY